MLALYDYWRSSASYRIRIALRLKGLDYRSLPVNLLKGEQRQDAYRDENPQGLLPALRLEDGRLIPQSLAILEWLEETHPTPSLLPGDAFQRAQIRAFALSIACDLHPLTNLRVLQFLTGDAAEGGMGLSDEQKKHWYRHWTLTGLRTAERQLAATERQGPFCFGTQPTLADVTLAPVFYNARRFGVPLDGLPVLTRIEAHCRTQEAFLAAEPERQPDAVPA